MDETQVQIPQNAPADVTQQTQQPESTQQQVQPSTPEATTQTEFKVPDAYAQKGWASKVKSQDDLYKLVDNLDGLAGKKTIQPIDYSKATPEEIEAYHAKLRPADGAAYKFAEGSDPAFSKAVADVFLKNGISEYQGNEIIKAVNEISATAYQAKLEADTSLDGYNAMMAETFGEKASGVSGFVDSNLRKHATDADKQLFDNVDNKTRVAIDRTVFNILKAYGVTESGAQAGAPSVSPNSNVEATRAALRDQIRALESKPHSPNERATLIDRLNKTYQK